MPLTTAKDNSLALPVRYESREAVTDLGTKNTIMTNLSRKISSWSNPTYLALLLVATAVQVPLAAQSLNFKTPAAVVPGEPRHHRQPGRIALLDVPIPEGQRQYWGELHVDGPARQCEAGYHRNRPA